MLCRPNNRPIVGQDVSAMVCWMAERPLREGSTFAIKHTTRWARARVRSLQYRLDVNALHRDSRAAELELNDIGRIHLRTTAPLFYDEYRPACCADRRSEGATPFESGSAVVVARRPADPVSLG